MNKRRLIGVAFLGSVILENLPFLSKSEHKTYHEPIKAVNTMHYSDQTLAVSGTASGIADPIDITIRG